MRVVDIKFLKDIEFADSDESDTDKSFESFQQEILREREFCNIDWRDSEGNQPILSSDVFPYNFPDDSSPKLGGTLKEISPTKVMDFDDGFAMGSSGVSSSPAAEEKSNNQDDFNPSLKHSWCDIHQSDNFESHKQSNLNFDIPEVEEEFPPKKLFGDEPKENILSKDLRKDWIEAENFAFSTTDDETRKDGWWSRDFDDNEEGNEETVTAFGKLSFDDKIKERMERKPNSVVCDLDHAHKEKMGSCNLDLHGFPISTTECTDKEQQEMIRNDCPKPDDISITVSVTSRSTKWKSSSSKGARSRFSKKCLSLPICSDYYIQTEDQVDTDSAKQTVGNQENQEAKNNNDWSKKEGSQWERLLAKVPMGTRVKANILQVRQTIMACHEPDLQKSSSSDIVKEASVENEDSAATKGSGDECVCESTEQKLNDSVLSYKSVQQVITSVLSTSQEAISIPSDASTPIRTQTKRDLKVELNSSSSQLVHNLLDNLMNLKHKNRDFNDSDSKLKLCIDHYKQSAFKALMSNLKDNLEITELHIFRSWDGNSERSRNSEDIALLFKTIQSLPNLEILNLANFLTEEIHFVALTQWQNQNLSTVRIHVCKGAISQRLLNILAELPALQDLTLEMNESFPFHILLSSRTLESLTIIANDFNVDNLHAMETVHSVPKNKILKKLTIEPPLELRTFKLLAAALRKNTGIEDLKFSLIPGNHADTNSAICELARTLTTNSSLKTITNINPSDIKVRERTCDVMMRALAENFIIEEFVAFDEEPWFRTKKDNLLAENKGEIEPLFPQIFNCVEDTGRNPPGDDEDDVDDASSDDGESYSVSDGVAMIGNNMKSQAKRAVSSVTGALDLVGIQM